MQHDAASFGHFCSASWDVPYALTFFYFMTPFQFPLKHHGTFALTSSNFFSVAFFVDLHAVLWVPDDIL